MVAVGLLVMMYPILCKVKYETLHRVFAHRQIWIQLGFSVFVNWIVAPLLMVSFEHRSLCRVFTDSLIYSLDLLGLSYQMSQVYALVSFLSAWLAASLWYVFTPESIDVDY